MAVRPGQREEEEEEEEEGGRGVETSYEGSWNLLSSSFGRHGRQMGCVLFCCIVEDVIINEVRVFELDGGRVQIHW